MGNRTSGQNENMIKHSDNKNKNNVLSCCMAVETETETEVEPEADLDLDLEAEAETKTDNTKMDRNTINTVNIIDVDLNANDDDDSKHDLNSAVVDTTNAFLELLQLDTMSQHLQDMRDRRMFLEKAAHDKDLPEEERQIAAWITDTYLSKSPTMNYPQILENIMKKQQQSNTNTTKNKNKSDKQKHAILSKEELKQIIAMDGIDPQGALVMKDTVITLLSQINEWNFSVFEFVEHCNHSSLSLLMITICRSRRITEKLNIPEDALIQYMNLVDVNYLENPYHNHTHAADVLLNMFYFMKSSIFYDNIDILDSFSILLAASVHDIGHPGHGNSFEINTESELSITYNDQSVLENMHICLCWNLLKENTKNGHDMLMNMTRSQKKRFRMVVIDSVLATDMSQHSVHSETLEQLVEKYENKTISNIGDKFANEFLPIALHTADLGNICKETKYYNEWVVRLMNEFFNQGDKERKLGIEPLSFLCDRFKVNIHCGQVGFINFVMRPWFIKFGRLLSEDSHNTLFLNLLNKNLKYMQQRANQTKNAQEEIKKHIRDNDEDNVHNVDNHDIHHMEDREMDDIVHPLPNLKPKIIDIEATDDNMNSPEITNSRTSKSYSIVAMSFPEMRSKLLEWSTNDKANKESKENVQND